MRRDVEIKEKWALAVPTKRLMKKFGKTFAIIRISDKFLLKRKKKSLMIIEFALYMLMGLAFSWLLSLQSDLKLMRTVENENMSACAFKNLKYLRKM